MDASLQQALNAAKAAIANLTQAFEISTDQQSLSDRPVRQEAITSSQIEGIHPFLDGNGRVGRNLIIWQLCQEKITSTPLFLLSTYFKQHQSTYFSLLSHARRPGHWEAWLQFFFGGLEASVEVCLSSDFGKDLTKC